jgi:hypothetical protein
MNRWKADGLLALLCFAVFMMGVICGNSFKSEPVAKPVHIVRVYQA